MLEGDNIVNVVGRQKEKHMLGYPGTWETTLKATYIDTHFAQ